MVAENQLSTVVANLTPAPRNATGFQSEAEMERDFIKQLVDQGYEYLPIKTEQELLANLRSQLERLNNYKFSDSEWQTFFKNSIANQNYSIAKKTEIIQKNHIQLLTRDDGNTKNIYLIDKNNVHNNSLQVINQYVPEGGARGNRYDVTILVNGLPLVHVELKRRGVDIKEAFNQINRYSRESFWAGSGLFEYVQLFVISNGTQTKYYSNTTRNAHIAEMEKATRSKKQTSNSFEFTSFWADEENKIIPDLVDFTATFFAKHTLLNVLTRYCVLTCDGLLLVMRPYQIAATESILRRIVCSTSQKKYGTVEGGGYVWHTTGSGKTLTSFKAAQLASRMEGVDKVLFVVDRKDLDYQTMREYDRFEQGAANSNSSTAVQRRQLENPQAHIIITTIQKLSRFITKNPQHEVYDKHVVFIFDECHRSQFGSMHTAIVNNFKKYHLFGFTGTPIFTVNAGTTGRFDRNTTPQAFGERLHRYTIVNAIADGNVLPFRVEYISTMRQQENIQDEQVRNIDRGRALMAPDRIRIIVSYILEHFAQKTKRNAQAFEFNKVTNINEMTATGNRRTVNEERQKTWMTGFNSIFAVSSIEAAKLYYMEFKQQMEQLPPERRLRVATIFSCGTNEEDDGTGLLDDENSESTKELTKLDCDFLESAIGDYNAMFRTNFDTSDDRFQNYYKDVSLRMKNRELDLLIVVNMFLTGFDATTLNTLWVDKNLRMHGLLQAYSRTNRILNSVKTFGNIVCFRNLEKATNESIALFGGDAGGVALLRTFDEYYYGYEDDKGKKNPGYKELVETLLQDYPIGQPIVGEEAEKDFIRQYGTILKATNVLSTFDQFDDEKKILTPRDVQDYHSLYIDLHDKYRQRKNGEVANVNDDLVFEMELIKQVEINIDYILHLVAQLRGDLTKDKEIRISIQKAVSASPNLRNKKDLIEDFVEQMTPEKDVNDEWCQFVKRQQKEQLDNIISEERLKKEETYEFVTRSFKDGEIEKEGTAIGNILPPTPLFTPDDEWVNKKRSVTAKLEAFFEKFFDISGGTFASPTQDE